MATTRRIRIYPLLLGVLMLVLLLIPIAEASKGGRLVIGRAEDAESLDPTQSGAFATIDTLRYLYQPLVSLDMNGQIVGNAAESWTVSDDALEYTFHLREGIKFHDGTMLDAAAVKVHFDRTMDPETAGRSASWISALEQTEVIDDYTVRMTLSHPFSPFLEQLTDPAYGIPSPSAVEQWDEDFGRHPVGSGPFMFEEWQPGDHITLVRNPDYQSFLPYVENKEAPYIEELVFRVIPESQTLIAAFEAGDVDLIQLPPQYVDDFRDRKGFRVYNKPDAGTLTNFVEYNFAKPPFDDVRVRKAFAHAIDVPLIIDTILEGQAVRNFCPQPVGLPGWTEDCRAFGYGYDPGAARALLNEAGWTNGSGGVRQKDGERLEILFTTFSADPFRRIAQVIQAMAGQVGFEVHIETYEVGTQLARISAPEIESNADLINWGWPTPHLLHVMTHSEQPLGRYRHLDPEFEELMAKTLAEQDDRKRYQLYQEAQRILLENAAAVPLYSDIFNYAVHDDVRGFKIGPQVSSYLGILVLEDTYIEE